MLLATCAPVCTARALSDLLSSQLDNLTGAMRGLGLPTVGVATTAAAFASPLSALPAIMVGGEGFGLAKRPMHARHSCAVNEFHPLAQGCTTKAFVRTITYQYHVGAIMAPAAEMLAAGSVAVVLPPLAVLNISASFVFWVGAH